MLTLIEFLAYEFDEKLRVMKEVGNIYVNPDSIAVVGPVDNIPNKNKYMVMILTEDTRVYISAEEFREFLRRSEFMTAYNPHKPGTN